MCSSMTIKIRTLVLEVNCNKLRHFDNIQAEDEFIKIQRENI